MPPPSPSPARGSRARLAVFVVLVLAVLVARPAWEHLRSVSLLLRFADTSPPSGLRAVGVVAVDASDLSFVSPSGAPIRARYYTPRGVADPPGIVLLHGVHRLGIAEPRLVRFANAIAASGIRVLTPEVRELADYRVDPISIDTIGAAARELRHATRADRTVGVMGMSFAGGLALLAAADPRFAPSIDFVVTIGAHDDLARVSRFFATSTIPRPDGSILAMQAHDYGPLVLVYSHIEDFFPAADVPVARDALQAWLWDEQDRARATSAKLGDASRAKMDRLFDHRIDSIAPELLAEIDKNGPLMALVSPHGRLGAVRGPVYLLHGAGDTVIPPSETLWLEHDLPPAAVAEALVSPAINHVELGDKPSIGDEWAVIHFLAGVLGETERRPRSP